MMGPKTVNDSNCLRFHYLQLERCVKIDKGSKDVLRYNIRNHFNIPVLQVEGRKLFIGDNLNLDVIDLTAKKEISSSNILFRMLLSKPGELYSDDDFPANNQICTLISTSGETLGRVVNVKGMASTTCGYNITDTADQAVFKVCNEQIDDGQCELHIKPVSKKDDVAWIKTERDKTSLSMAPELDSLTKMRLICLMVFKELIRLPKT